VIFHNLQQTLFIDQKCLLPKFFLLLVVLLEPPSICNRLILELLNHSFVSFSKENSLYKF